MQIEATAPSWAEAVFHVLAHVRVAGAPSCLYAPWYVAHVQRALGRAEARPLGRDVALLSSLVREHRTLSRLQALAWLWREGEAALASSERDLEQLADEEVAAPELLEPLRRDVNHPIVETLRCAALLELDACAQLPPALIQIEDLHEALCALLPVAPALAQATVTSLGPLTRHGRVRGTSIFVGAPGRGVSLEHVALQAAHEATVYEVGAHAPALAERRVEAVALVLARSRVVGTTIAGAHAAWCWAWGVREHDLCGAALTSAERALFGLSGGAAKV